MIAAGTFSTDTSLGTASIERDIPEYGYVQITYSPSDDYFGERAQIMKMPASVFDRLVREHLSEKS